jgi:hypothetical protein
VPAPGLNLTPAIPDLRHNATPVSFDNPAEDVIASSPGMLMSNRSRKPLSALLIASFAGSMLAMIAYGSAHADDNCLAGPKATTPRGSHWYYRVEPGTKRHCWYLGAERGKTAQKAAAKPPLPAAAPNKPAAQTTSAASPLQPAVADARAEFDDAARDQTNANSQTNANPPSSDTRSSSDTPSAAASDQASADPSPSPSAAIPSTETAESADTRTSAVTTRWPDPAVNTDQVSNATPQQQPVAAAAVTPSPQLQNEQPTPPSAAAPPPQLLGERSDPGPAVRVVDVPEAETASYSVPMLLGGLAGALAFAGILGFAVIKFGSLSSFMHIRRAESIRTVSDTGSPAPWQQPNSAIAPPPHLRDPLRARREIEAQSRDIMEILSRASRGTAT